MKKTILANTYIYIYVYTYVYIYIYVLVAFPEAFHCVPDRMRGTAAGEGCHSLRNPCTLSDRADAWPGSCTAVAWPLLSAYSWILCLTRVPFARLNGSWLQHSFKDFRSGQAAAWSYWLFGQKATLPHCFHELSLAKSPANKGVLLRTASGYEVALVPR